VPRTWAVIGPPTDNLRRADQSAETDGGLAAEDPSASTEGGSDQSDRCWKIRMINTDHKVNEVDYCDLPWCFDSPGEAQKAIQDWLKGHMDPNAGHGKP
jgi:hypothetical protein